MTPEIDHATLTTPEVPEASRRSDCVHAKTHAWRGYPTPAWLRVGPQRLMYGI